MHTNKYESIPPNLIDQLAESAAYLQQIQIPPSPKWAIVSGSGMASLTEKLNLKQLAHYSQIPHWGQSTAPGHAGALFCGSINNQSILFFSGRLHYYEGYSLNEVVYPIRLARYLGIKNFVFLNAAGSINLSYQLGNWMIIEDHLNLIGDNPLIGRNVSILGVRFPSMENAYTEEWISHGKKCADRLNIKTHTGVYAAMSGPSYETKAEINMLRILGADAVGMSTVPEVIAARHCGAKVFALSIISNFGTGISSQPVEHEKIEEIVQQSIQNLPDFLRLFLT